MKTVRWFPHGIEGRHVFMGLIVFFGVMFVANGLLVYFALGTFSGGDRPDPYRSGLRYNETIEAAARQEALGWRTEVAYDEIGRLSLRVLDKTANPVVGLQLGAMIGRPATDLEDRAVDFEEISLGVYAADIDLAPGLWVISLASREAEGADPRYRLKRRLFVADRS
jgi:nitrogen fixation protein FixH